LLAYKNALFAPLYAIHPTHKAQNTQVQVVLYLTQVSKMKYTLTAFALAALAINAAAWEFAFADAPECLITGSSAGSGAGNVGCTAVTPDDDTDHVDITGLGNCIITFYENPGCPLNNGEFDAFDEGKLTRSIEDDSYR
jgi:hypothetical protein